MSSTVATTIEERRWRVPLFVAVLALALVTLLPGIASLPVTDRDEARFAQASRQMAVSGDWVDIRFQDTPRYKKPAGIYWLQAATLRLWRQGEGSAIWLHRLPSLIAAALACAALGWAGAPFVGRMTAAMAGAMMTAVLIVQVEARLATTDATLLLASTLAMGGLFHARMNHAGAAVAALFWLAISAGILLKGPVILLPMAGLIIWFWVTEGQPRWLAHLFPLRGLALTAVLVVPWFATIIWQSDGSFLRQSLVEDFGAKLASGQENHGAPPGSYLLGAAISFWPWTALAPLAIAWLWRNRRRDAARLIIAWVLPAWIVLELVPTKLLHYPMNLYPALMLAVALCITQLAAGAMRFRGWPAAIGGTLFASVLVALTALAILGPVRMGEGAEALAVIGALLALALGVVAIVWLRRGLALRSAAALVLCGSATMGTTAGIALPAMDQLWLSQRLASITEARLCGPGPIALAGYQEPSAVFLLGTDTILTDAATALDMLERREVAGAWIAVSDDTRPAAPGVAEVSGINYSNGRQVRLLLLPPPAGSGQDCKVPK